MEIDLAKEGSDKMVYMVKVAGIVIEVSRLTYDLAAKKDEEYMKALKGLDINYTNLFND